MDKIPFKSPLVVGYKGEVGSFLLNGLLRVMPKALNIWCFDINESMLEKEHRIKLADYIFLCVPMQDTVPWLLRHRKLLAGKIIIEQCSLKAPLYNIPGLKDLDIRSMHLLFRPSATPNLQDRRCAIVGDRMILIEDHIGKMTEATLLHYETYLEHDAAMAIDQALIHRVLLVLEQILKTTGAQTYTSRKIWELIKRLKAGDKTLYSLIQQNKTFPEVLRQFKDTLNNFKIEEYF